MMAHAVGIRGVWEILIHWQSQFSSQAMFPRWMDLELRVYTSTAESLKWLKKKKKNTTWAQTAPRCKRHLRSSLNLTTVICKHCSGKTKYCGNITNLLNCITYRIGTNNRNTNWISRLLPIYTPGWDAMVRHSSVTDYTGHHLQSCKVQANNSNSELMNSCILQLLRERNASPSSMLPVICLSLSTAAQAHLLLALTSDPLSSLYLSSLLKFPPHNLKSEIWLLLLSWESAAVMSQHSQ